MRPIEQEARKHVSAFREESGWKWKFFVPTWDREIYAQRTYEHKQTAMRAGRREYRRFFGPSIAEMMENEEL